MNECKLDNILRLHTMSTSATWDKHTFLIFTDAYHCNIIIKVQITSSLVIFVANFAIRHVVLFAMTANHTTSKIYNYLKLHCRNLWFISNVVWCQMNLHYVCMECIQNNKYICTESPFCEKVRTCLLL